MYALTIKNPWAWLIAQGIKRVENRSWPTAHRGPLAIHAGKTPDPLDDEVLGLFESLEITIPARLTYGAIVAVVNVVDCVKLDETYDLPGWLNDDPFAFGPFVWILEDARAVKPIPWKGKLGLWEYTGSIIPAVSP